MSIWTSLGGYIRGGWRTYGPGATGTSFALDSRDTNDYDTVSADAAMKLSAVHSCLERRAEAGGTLPWQVIDKDKNILYAHPIYRLLHDSPNTLQTSAEFWSQQWAHEDMHGNGISIVHFDGDKPIMLEPINDPTQVKLVQGKRMSNIKYEIGGDKFRPEEILHLRGFTMDTLWGLSRLECGQHILSAQAAGNTYSQKAFKQGLKVGGFFTNDGPNLEKPQAAEFKKILDNHALPENIGKWLLLLKGMKPVGGAQFSIKPAEAELLMSRYFGIEEICRLFNVPPQLIGHSDKSSSWASSLEQINLFFLIYSLMPTIVRHEQRVSKILLTDADRAKGVRVRCNFGGLLRGDTRTQMMAFASGLQNGYINRNEVRDLMDRAGIGAEGDKYLVQMNMAQQGDKPPVANE